MTRPDRSDPFETLPDGTYRFESGAYRAERAALAADATASGLPTWARCQSTYPGAATLNGRAIRCELPDTHDGEHGHSFAARYWDGNDETAATDADIASRHAAYHGGIA